MYRGQGGEFTISVPVGPERFHYLTSCASGREKARGGGGGEGGGGGPGLY